MISGSFVMMLVLSSALAGAERVFEIMDEETEKKDQKDALTATTLDGEISFKNVNFGYFPGQILIDGQDLRNYKRADFRSCLGVVLQDTLTELQIQAALRTLAKKGAYYEFYTSQFSQAD